MKRGYSEKINEEYQEVVQDALNIVEPSQRENARIVLFDVDAIKQYIIAKNELDLTSRQLGKIMAHNLGNFSKRKPITLARYAAGMAEELGDLEDSEEALDKMYHEKIISKRVYEDAVGEVREQIKHSARKTSSGLEKIARLAASILLIFTGAFIALSAGTGITGAAVGAKMQNSPGLVTGIVMLLIGLVTFPRK